MKTRKTIKLINDERMHARNVSAKGCDNSSTDYCYSDDFAICVIHSIDICATKDLAACYSHSVDVCANENDVGACIYGNEDYT